MVCSMSYDGHPRVHRYMYCIPVRILFQKSNVIQRDLLAHVHSSRIEEKASKKACERKGRTLALKL